jgi:hypothetical protein
MPPTATNTEAPADLAAKRAANDPDQTGQPDQVDTADLDALRAEVAAEPVGMPAADDDTWPRSIPLGDATVRVKHWLDWELDGDKHLLAVDISSWAEGVLVNDETGDDFKDVWKPAKPTLRQGLKFVKAVEVATGIPFAPHLASLTT